MHIFIFLLKILGILLLCIILLVFILLCSPVFYNIFGKIDNNTDIKGNIWFLFKIFSIDFAVNGTDFTYKIKSFGKEISSLETEDSKNEDSESKPEDAEGDTIENSKYQTSDKKKTVSKEKEKTPKSEPEDLEPKEPVVKKVSSKVSAIKIKLKKIWTECKDERNHLAVKHIWFEILYLLKKLKPKHIKMDLDFSMGDPALTGQVTGVLSLLPFVYKKRTRICPDFLSDKMYVLGEFNLKGNILLCHFLVVFYRVIKDKNIKRMYYRIKK